jgi:hypothetical protein
MIVRVESNRLAIVLEGAFEVALLPSGGGAVAIGDRILRMEADAGVVIGECAIKIAEVAEKPISLRTPARST